MLDVIGWLATAMFTSSYFFRQPRALRLIQALAACLWITYGAILHAMPVVAANVLVATAALYSLSRGRRVPSHTTELP